MPQMYLRRAPRPPPVLQSFAKFRRVPTTIGSARTSYLCVAGAVLATVLSAVFWNGILVTGGYFWVANNDNVGACSRVVLGMCVYVCVRWCMQRSWWACTTCRSTLLAAAYGGQEGFAVAPVVI